MGSEGLRCIMAAEEELLDPPVTSEEAAALPPTPTRGEVLLTAGAAGAMKIEFDS